MLCDGFICGAFGVAKQRCWPEVVNKLLCCFDPSIETLIWYNLLAVDGLVV
jgi:hypothetical protein